MRLTPLIAYQAYISVKLHFEREDYDAFKYNFKTNTNYSSFEKHGDTYVFEKACAKFVDRQPFIHACVANRLAGVPYIRDWIDEGYGHLERYNARRGRLTYDFTTAVHDLFSVRDRGVDASVIFFEDPDATYPVAIDRYMSRSFGPETVILLDRVFRFIDRVETSDALLWPREKMRLQKYSPFVPGHPHKYRRIVETVASERV